MRNLLPALALLTMIFFSVPTVQSQHSGDYAVLITTVQGGVPMSYFDGMDGVYSKVFYGDLHQYYKSGFTNRENAEAFVAQAKAKQFISARVVSTDELRALAAACCMAPEEDFTIRNVFFDFDRADLRSEGRAELNKLVTIMKANPEYSVELHAHTDARGSLEYNVALSKRRRDAVKTYLLSNGISGDRIQTFTYGEDTPIAKNEVNGADTPEGRQLNRRVELRVKENGVDAGKVEDIAVPEYLKE